VWCSADSNLRKTLSHTAARLLAGTPALAFLDHTPPWPNAAVPQPERVIALPNPAICYELEDAATWDLAHAEREAMRDDIRARVEALTRTLCAEPLASSERKFQWIGSLASQPWSRRDAKGCCRGLAIF
jgi:hypothetical protein